MISWRIGHFTLGESASGILGLEAKWALEFYFCVSVHRSIGQIKHQFGAALCRFYFCSHSTCFGRQAPIIRSIKKLARRPLVQVLQLRVGHHITILGTKLNACSGGYWNLLWTLWSLNNFHTSLGIKLRFSGNPPPHLRVCIDSATWVITV
jgi:hypothetical protein